MLEEKIYLRCAHPGRVAASDHKEILFPEENDRQPSHICLEMTIGNCGDADSSQA